MRFPFVSRATFEVQASFTDHLVRELAKEQQRSASLLETVVSMRLSGGTVQRLAPLPEGQKIEQPKRDPVRLAIDNNPHAKRNPRLRAQMVRHADKQLEAGVSPEAIEAEFKAWSVVSGAEDDDDDVIALGV